MTRDREGHYIMIKGSLKQEDIAILDAHPAKVQKQFNGGRIIFSKYSPGATGYS